MGITNEDYQLVTGRNIWLGTDRPHVRKVLDDLAAGVMDLTGTARFEMPAEYVAMVIRVFVHPVNVATACNWQANMRPGSDIIGASSQGAIIEPGMLFTLICDMYSDDASNQVQAQFEKNVGAAIRKAAEAPKSSKAA